MAFVDDFAELGEYIDTPLTGYSSGMRVRLAFGVSMAISFDCYLVDEITARRRCALPEAVLRGLPGPPQVRRRDHGVPQPRRPAKRYCDTGAILADGKLRLFDDAGRGRQASIRGVLTPGTRAAEADWDEGDDE